jgi:integrase
MFTADLTFGELASGYLEDYLLQGYRGLASARSRVANLRRHFDGRAATGITSAMIRAYQVARRRDGAATGTINRETSALARMFRLAVRHGLLSTMPVFPQRLEENPPRQGFFEHAEYLRVRGHLPSAYQDILDFAYYSGWRRREITELTWDEIDETGGVIRLSPARSKTKSSRLLPISAPLAAVLARRQLLRRPHDPRVFYRDGVTVRAWRRAWPTACRRAGVPHRLLHDCRRTAARNLIRAGVPERVAMLLTGHKTRCIFDRYNIVNEQELLLAGQRLVAYVEARAAALSAGMAPIDPVPLGGALTDIRSIG